jgi:putative transposase
VNHTIHELLRARLGRNPQPSAAIVDSQSAKTSGVGGEARGYDGGKKKIRGRKRQLLVDTEGLVLKAEVHSAKVPDQDGLRLLLESARSHLPRLSHLWLDAGYQGRGKDWAENVLWMSVEVVHLTPKPTPEKIARIWAEEWAKEGEKIDWQRLLPRRGFEVLPRRWVVERTFAWICHNRRMSKDYERLCATSEAFVYVAMTRLMVRRLAPWVPLTLGTQVAQQSKGLLCPEAEGTSSNAYLGRAKQPDAQRLLFSWDLRVTSHVTLLLRPAASYTGLDARYRLPMERPRGVPVCWSTRRSRDGRSETQ